MRASLRAVIGTVTGMALAAVLHAADADCVGCHAASADTAIHAVFNSAHATIGGGNDNCIACHGASEAHGDAPSEEPPAVSFGPRWPASPERRSEACVGCHQSGPATLWAGSEHQRNDLACDSCHSTHSQWDMALDRDRALDICSGCHQRQRAELRLPSRHPVLEGKTACGDCHDPHGSLAEGALHQVSLNDNCLSCHQEKRGPFLWEHQPVAEDCSLCHRPHGSVNSRLLTARGPALCQQCHAAAFHPSLPYGGEGTAGGLPNRNLVGRNCLNCHSQVHGSNHPSGARLAR